MIPRAKPAATFATFVDSGLALSQDVSTAPLDADQAEDRETIMNANTLVDATERFAQRSMQLVLVRANGPLFYTVAAASVLESMAPAYTARLRKLFQGDHELSAWLDNVWLPAKAARAAA